MRITICGSVNFPERIREMEKGLRERGHEVVIPYSIIKDKLKGYEDAQKLKEGRDYISKEKPYMMRRHLDEIKNSDAILVVNVEKKGIPNYIGGATFSEIIFASYLRKRIFLLNPIPTHEGFRPFRDEIEAVKPIVINGNLEAIK